MRNLKLSQLATQLWRDERGFIQSAELILIGTLAVIGLIVGLAAFRDATVQELADTGAAVGQLNQSYSVAITSGANNLDDIELTVTGNLVEIEGDFGNVVVTSTFNNYGYNDLPDLGDGQDQTGLPPGIVSIGGTQNEGVAPPTPGP